MGAARKQHRGCAMIKGIYSSLSALFGFQKKVDAIAHNTANVNTDGFKHSQVHLEESAPLGVKATVRTIDTPGPTVLEQTPEGQQLVEKSNVDLSREIPNLMMSRRFYQANLKTIKVEDEMLGSLLDIKS